MRHNNRMIIIFIRTAIIFLTLMIVMRLMGKRQIGEMQPFEFIITMIIADLACIPMADVSIPLVYGVVAILALFLLHQLIFLLENCGSFLQRVISGKPSVVINKNGVDLKELKRNDMSVSDLIESMRTQGYFSLDDVDYAIYEANGNLSALEKQKKEGYVAAENTRLGESFVTDFLKKQNALLKDVAVMTADSNGRIYFQKRGEKYKICRETLPKEAQW